jgi:hypothetical protein
MNATYTLIRLGAASELTQGASGMLLLEELMTRYDPI